MYAIASPAGSGSESGILLMSHRRKIAVIGLGYVGLPVAVAFAREGFAVTGFDIDASRVRELESGQDRTREVEASDLKHPSLRFTRDADGLRASDFFIVTVPTPIDEARQPDLRAMFEASRLVGAALKKGDIVVYESTVYPGAVEEECAPILEQCSGLRSVRISTSAIRRSASIPATSSIAWNRS